jgi:hypothetical protein
MPLKCFVTAADILAAAFLISSMEWCRPYHLSQFVRLLESLCVERLGYDGVFAFRVACRDEPLDWNGRAS